MHLFKLYGHSNITKRKILQFLENLSLTVCNSQIPPFAKERQKNLIIHNLKLNPTIDLLN